MHDQCVLDLLGIDVDATGDDHERLAIGEVQEALVVEVANVAERRPVGVFGVLGPPGSWLRRRGTQTACSLVRSTQSPARLREVRCPSSSQMWGMPSTARPTDPGWVNQSSLLMNVKPLPSVPA